MKRINHFSNSQAMPSVSGVSILKRKNRPIMCKPLSASIGCIQYYEHYAKVYLWAAMDTCYSVVRELDSRQHRSRYHYKPFAKLWFLSAAARIRTRQEHHLVLAIVMTLTTPLAGLAHDEGFAEILFLANLAEASNKTTECPSMVNADNFRSHHSEVMASAGTERGRDVADLRLCSVALLLTQNC